MNNYRPITILPFMSKLMVKTILQSLRNHIEDNELITKCQAGFQRMKSANTMLIKLTWIMGKSLYVHLLT